jgi:toxin YhaV
LTRTKRSTGPSRSEPALVVNGWQLFAHPLLLDQVERLIAAMEKERSKHPADYKNSANAKLLAALSKLLFETVPSDPTRAEYRQGSTLRPERKHWFRAKFGGQRFRLFFRYSSKARIIVYAWVNDSATLRAYGAKTDAYAVFAAMLAAGDPPDDWNALLKSAKAKPVADRLRRIQIRKRPSD